MSTQESPPVVAGAAAGGLRRPVRAGSRPGRPRLPHGAAPAAADRDRAGLRQLQLSRDWLLLERAHVRLHRLAGRVAARRRSLVLLRSDAAGSSSSADRQRHPEPLRAARKRRGARDAGRRGVDCGGNRAGPGAAPGHRRRLPDDQVGVGEAAAPPENGGSRSRPAAPPDRPEAVAGEAARTIDRQGREPPLLRSRVGAARCTTPRCQPPGPGSSRRRPAGYRSLITYWIVSAKKPETRQKRLDALIEASEAGRRLR